MNEQSNKRNSGWLIITVAAMYIVSLLAFSAMHTAELNELELSKDATISSLMGEIQKLNSETVDYKYEVDHLEDECDELIWNLYVKDTMLIEAGIQPYELLPCYNCRSKTVIGIDYDESVFYVGCTECCTYTHSFRESEDAAVYWNTIAK